MNEIDESKVQGETAKQAKPLDDVESVLQRARRNKGYGLRYNEVLTLVAEIDRLRSALGGIICPECGVKNVALTTFCGNCGYEF